ncbi:S8 family serine peptidase [Clostridium sp.]|uniref:S8 family serine peptidase n=1 Tax=Clostridium sp. TaxID=1506 RepID=UPI003F35F565
MELKYNHSGYYSGELFSFLVQYNGDILQQLNNVSYAFGNIINDKLAIVICRYEDIQKLKNDVPAIIYIDKYNVFVLEDVNPSSTSGITQVIENPYLSLSGQDIIVGLLDTGIDYLNEDFMFEDGKTKILTIWDQSIDGKDGGNLSPFKFGTVYSSEDINNAIMAKQRVEDPYKIVESKDLNGHGTKIAGIIGGKGYSKKYSGIAQNCLFAVVKLKESMYF